MRKAQPRCGWPDSRTTTQGSRVAATLGFEAGIPLGFPHGAWRREGEASLHSIFQQPGFFSPTSNHTAPERPSTFALRISFVICHLSFVIQCPFSRLTCATACVALGRMIPK